MIFFTVVLASLVHSALTMHRTLLSAYPRYAVATARTAELARAAHRAFDHFILQPHEEEPEEDSDGELQEEEDSVEEEPEEDSDGEQQQEEDAAENEEKEEEKAADAPTPAGGTSWWFW